MGDAARIRLVNLEDRERALQALRPLERNPANGQTIIEFSEGAEGLIEARMTAQQLRELSRQAAQQSIEVIRRRIDPDGTAEISIPARATTASPCRRRASPIPSNCANVSARPL